MNYKTGLEDFIGKESLSKTLRNALIPTESTKIHMEEMGVIRDDELRAEKQQELKEIMDDYYRAFIEEKLGQIQGIQWNSLFQKMEETMEDISVRKDLDKIQNEKRKEICCYFTSDKRFKDLFNAKLITDILPNFIKDNKEYTEEEKAEKEQTRVLFQRFATAFTNYFNQRRNNFSEDNISTAISFRIVNENSEIHLQNMRAFQRIEQQYPEEVCGMEEEYKDMLQEWQMKHIYSVDFYDRELTQPGIEYYNGICGKINEHMNQFCQKNRINKNDFRMKKLHKQILCKKSSYYEIPFRFESDQEVYDALNEFIKTMKKKEIIRRCVHLGQECDDYDLGKIYISSNKYEQISNALYGSWDTIRKCIKEEYMDALPGKGEKKEEKAEAAAKKEEYRSIADIDKIISLYGSEMDRTISAKKCITEICDMAGQISIDPLVCNSDIKLLQNKEKTTEIKTILDSFLHVYQWGQTFIVSDIIEKDSYFYSELEDVLEDFEGITTLYNHVRSYVTQKPYSTVKFKLHFGSPTLANGWSQSKEYDNNAILLMRDQKFYLGIFNVRNKPDKQIIKGHEKEEKGDYKKMIYNLLPGPSKMLPKVFITSRSGQETYKPSKHILDGYNEKRHIKSSPKFDLGYCWDLIDYYKECIHKHPDWKNYDFHFSDTKDYEDISGFYREVEMQGYQIKWTYISADEIQKLDEKGQIFLFQIYNKDFSVHSTGKDNLHTMYLKNLFSEENLKDIVLKLNGEAELFFRKASIKTPIVHKKGSVLVNRSYTQTVGNKEIRVSIPEEYYTEIYNYLNHIGKGKLSSEAQRYLDEGKIKSFTATKDIVKNYRYCCDHYFLHLPITINFKAKSDIAVNERTLAYIAKKEDIHIIGIDRGERNLLYISVIDVHGNIREQRSFNIVNGYDYQQKLKDREKSRDAARKNWEEIEKIKELKEGYLSMVIHYIARLVVKYNAVVAMEDLNYGFKTGRFKVERQVYQKFETMLIEKLHYLVFKDREVCEEGGVLRGYQLTYIPESLKKVGKQCGFIFYVPAGYTSKIDPTTGFVNLFSFKNLTNRESRQDFVGKFDEIRYDRDKKMFEFSFDYNNYIKKGTILASTKWKVYTNGTRLKRIVVNGKYTSQSMEVELTDAMEKMLQRAGIEYHDGKDLKGQIVEKGIEAEIIDIFRLTVQMRNSRSESEDREYDRLISPVLNDKGEFFDTATADKTLPQDADANGAYCIALKGLYEVKQIKENWKENEQFPRNKLVQDNKTWFDFMQKKRYL